METTNITPFTYNNHQVRVVTGPDGEPWFILADLCRVLELKNPRDVASRLDRGDVGTTDATDSVGRTVQMNTVTESGMYDTVLLSRKPEARAFRRWLTHDVVPSVRKRGGYLTPEATEKALMDPDFIIQLATSLKEERAAKAALEAQAAEDAPYTLFGRAASKHDTDLLVKDVAALITQAGAPIGSGTLFRWLRKHGWLCKRLGRMWNHPTQWAIDKGYIRARIHFVSTASGDLERVTPHVTVAGQQALIEGWATGEFFDDLTGADK
nr:MAG TPA: repressor domain protein [Caudoviricetes sp.]